MNLALSLLPIVLLIYLMVKKNAMPSYKALPLIAVLVFGLQWLYFKASFVSLSANIVAGLMATLTPITVIFGAILFNRMMEETGCTNQIRRWLSSISPNPVAQLMIIGWAFAFMIEGASGFGTPAAIAAPILVGLGFNPFKVAVFALVMNSVPVSFGAVGTPTWFGFSELIKSGALDTASILEIGRQTAIMHFIAGFIIPLIALRFITTWEDIKKNLTFIYISILSCTVPYVILAQFNYEFPSLIAGGVGLWISVVVANAGIGLDKGHGEKAVAMPKAEVVKALLPLIMLMVILIVTRIHQLGLKGLLNDATPMVTTSLGFADLEISRALIVSVKNIFGAGVSESYKTLYVPALIPFVVTVVLAFAYYGINPERRRTTWKSALMQTRNPFIALMGALIMVKLMMAGGEASMVKTIGKGFAEIAKDNWIYYASYLGAIGAFFSGSNTVSNLTFGSIQYEIAQSTGLKTTTVLAAQSVGGAMGNMVCINNIVAVCSVLNVKNSEGSILRLTIIPMTIYGIIAAIVISLFWL
ncbi:MAG: L-lactate permease [Cardiobacteriaceae bacterium]|nr:L-lactate permease [Cardiobacteriaceae bacterium]